LIAAFLAVFAAFLTWLTLGYSEFDATEQIIGAIGMFLVAGATLSHYMMTCMERHCHHHEHHAKHRQAHHGRKLGQRPPPIRA
jgi:hypothetical protein